MHVRKPINRVTRMSYEISKKCGDDETFSIMKRLKHQVKNRPKSDLLQEFEKLMNSIRIQETSRRETFEQ